MDKDKNTDKDTDKDKNISNMPPFVKDNNGAAFYWKVRNITHGRMHIIVEMLSEYNLHYTQPRVLGMIHRMDSPTQKELADAMNTSPAAMSATLKRLQKAGLVEKISLEEDSRKNKIRLTEKGAKIHEDTFDKTLAIDRAMLDGFSEEETAELFAYLDRIQNNIDNIKNADNTKNTDNTENTDTTQNTDNTHNTTNK